MKVHCSGTAEIISKDDGRSYTINADELDWDVVGSDERSMGAELHHQAEIQHDELGLLAWSLWEYPLGAQNLAETNVGEHTIVRNFDFRLEHTPDD